jgi:hypothetical protein
LAGNVIPLITTDVLSADNVTFGVNCTPLASSSNVFPFTVLLLNASENVSTTALFNPIPDAPFCGDTASTTGAVASTPATVVNVLDVPFTWFPATSSTWLVFTTAVIEVLGGNGELGVNVTTPFTTPLFNTLLMA